MRSRQRELGRGERVLPGLWRLRLPLPWPGVPHGNAWAIAAGDGIVLVDTGIHSEDSMSHLELALSQVGLSLAQVSLLLITHAHSDHCGEAGSIVARAGCEMWMHPDHEAAYRHYSLAGDDLAHELEAGRRSGVAEAVLMRYAERATNRPAEFAELREPDRPLVDGVMIETDLGTWEVHETPGHAPSHVCLHQPERRLLISGDLLLGRIALYFDHGATADPVGQFLDSVDRAAGLGARLALSGHGKPFFDVPGHVDGTRRAVQERLDAALAALRAGPRTAAEIGPQVHGPERANDNPAWLLPQTLCFLEHLEHQGRVVREPDGGLERWSVTTA